MQPSRGTKDILPNEIILWQTIYDKVKNILTLSDYKEIRTPIFENTEIFKRSIGSDTDIINKEMYSFKDRGGRDITLRPEGTASVIRAFLSNKLYASNEIHRMWYLGPMFRYERPQAGRQRQFHQLGVECIGSYNSLADAEVIRLAEKILNELNCINYTIEINCIGNQKERDVYKKKLTEYLLKYEQDLNEESKRRIKTNPLRILDSKDQKVQEILTNAPQIASHLELDSLQHFNELREHLNNSNIKYTINKNLIRGLDYYNCTAFEIKTDSEYQQNAICGGGRYDQLIQQLGGPNIPSVGWAIGIERLIKEIKKTFVVNNNKNIIYLANYGTKARKEIWKIINILEQEKIAFHLDLSNNNFQKQLKKAHKIGAKLCILLGNNEIENNILTIKNMDTGEQTQISCDNIYNYFKSIKKSLHLTN
uniref:Histidine--tRNA ligase, chloroplastic n=1 Tax=Spyridia filamentosa TaxID=196632 RepID=A0A1Z1MKH8_SPYFI|nr:Histidine-tRNA ligase [Spyridia filamentosa]ARW66305.1 Histidine-tRNA ligase [Spyridia filamentosa]